MSLLCCLDHPVAERPRRCECLQVSRHVSSGDIHIDGERINDVPTQHRDLAMVFQSYALYPHMTIAENIGYPLRVESKIDKNRAR